MLIRVYNMDESMQMWTNNKVGHKTIKFDTKQ
jgi:hypothetical protein